MATTLMLVCAAATRSSRSGGFAAPDEALDAGGVADAHEFGLTPRWRDVVWCSPARAAGETAAAMGVTAAGEPALADIDHGRWVGLSFAQVEAAEPGALLAWLGDPLQGAPGGETMAQVQARVGHWLDRIAAAPGARCALTHAMTIRAALAHALGFPLRTTLAIDVAPLSRTVLSFNGQWRLQSLGRD